MRIIVVHWQLCYQLCNPCWPRKYYCLWKFYITSMDYLSIVYDSWNDMWYISFSFYCLLHLLVFLFLLISTFWVFLIAFLLFQVLIRNRGGVMATTGRTHQSTMSAAHWAHRVQHFDTLTGMIPVCFIRFCHVTISYRNNIWKSQSIFFNSWPTGYGDKQLYISLLCGLPCPRLVSGQPGNK